MKKGLLSKLVIILVLISTISTFALTEQRMDNNPCTPSNHTSINANSYASTEQESKQEPYVEDGVFMCSCGIPYSKHLEHSHTDDIGVNAYKCYYCSGNIIITKTPGKTWFYTGEIRKCQHKANGHDYEMARHVIVDYKCTDCAYVDSIVTQEYKWECRGW